MKRKLGITYIFKEIHSFRSVIKLYDAVVVCYWSIPLIEVLSVLFNMHTHLLL
jgi:hypothetical protein